MTVPSKNYFLTKPPYTNAEERTRKSSGDTTPRTGYGLQGSNPHRTNKLPSPLLRIEAQSSTELASKISQWLTPVNHHAMMNDTLSKRQVGTGQWFLESKEYKTWCSGKTKTLFCPGLPGAGKTVMTSLVTDDIQTRYQQNPEIGIAYLFCNYKLRHEQSARDLLASVLKQLLEQQGTVGKSLEERYNNHIAEKTHLTVLELTKEICEINSRLQAFFLIIDGLDECSNVDGHDDVRDSRDWLLEEIREMQKQARTSLLVTSRPLTKLAQYFRGEYSLEIRARDTDMRRFLSERIPRLPLGFFLDFCTQEAITTKIIKAADGMFLLTHLNLISLANKGTRHELLEVVSNLPKGIKEIDTAYEAIMDRITHQHPRLRELALRSLLLVICARRPLKVNELHHALLAREGERALDNIKHVEKRDIFSACASLIIIDQESELVQLVHYTAQDYFQKTRTRWFGDAEAEISKVCLTYLSINAFNAGWCYTDDVFNARLRAYPFMAYAAGNWGHHGREASSDSMNGRVLEFLEREGLVSSSSQAMTTSMGQHRHGQHTTAVHLAAYFGLQQVLEILLRGGHYPDSPDPHDRTPLSWAAESGYDASVELLLASRRVDVNSRDKSGDSPLSWAAKRGHCKAVTRILRQGAKIDMRNFTGETPLLLAARHGHTTAVELLLMNRASVNSKDNMDMTPLAWAASGGHLSLIRLLLKQEGLQPDCKEHTGLTPLSLAASRGHGAVVKQLLTKVKLDPNSVDQRSCTPLSWAANNGHDAVVSLLINDSRVHPDHPDRHGQTPFSLVALEGRTGAVGLLPANKKVDTNSRSVDGRSPLSFAATQGHTSVVKTLLADPRVEPDLRDECGQTPLLWATANRHEGVAEALLRTKKVNPSLMDKRGSGPLYRARKTTRIE